MQIMITGASGQLGSLIIQNLLSKIPTGRLIAGIHTPDRAAAFTSEGVETRLADYDDPEGLEEAFAGVTRLLLISSPHADDKVRLAQHGRVIAAAGKAGVSHILYTSFAFPRQDHAAAENVHLLTEQAILESGMKYTFLRNALYVDFVNVLGLNEAITSGELITPPGDWRFNAVTREDLALAAAAVLTGEGHSNRVYELTAPRTWDFTGLAAELTALSGKKVLHREDAGVRHWMYNFLSQIDTVSTSDDLEMLMGRQVTSLKHSIAPFVKSPAGDTC